MRWPTGTVGRVTGAVKLAAPPGLKAALAAAAAQSHGVRCSRVRRQTAPRRTGARKDPPAVCLLLSEVTAGCAANARSGYSSLLAACQRSPRLAVPNALMRVLREPQAGLQHPRA